MRDHEVTIATMQEIHDLFYGRQFVACLAKIEQERRYMSGGCGWSAKYPMSRAYVKERLNYWQAQSESLLVFA
jgi:hypothetical protein